MRAAVITLFVLIFAPSVLAQDGAPIPFELPLPDGWRRETIPFPLDFAPELDYEGLEELRFAPGMFDAESDEFWTYAFVWWVSIDTKLPPERLESDLESYFRGLSVAVAKAREFDPGEPTYKVELGETPSPNGMYTRFDVVVDTFDPFTTREAVRLNGRVEFTPCHKQEHLAVLFLFSPKPKSHAVWKPLREIRDGFLCSK